MTKFNKYTVKELIDLGIIEAPMDGNHGELHPTTKDYVEKGIPFLMASDIDNNKIDFQNCNKISKETADGLRKGFAKNNDVLITHKATIGRTAILETDLDYVVLTPQVTYYRVLDDSKLDYKYLKYYFDSPYFQAIMKKRAGDGSTRAYLGILEQQKLPVLIPEINEQKRIVKLLEAIDNKTKCNDNLINELELLLEEIFVYWFLQFNFPDKDKKPYSLNNGKMEYNEELKQDIPYGWEYVPLDECIETIIDHRGLTPTKLGGEWVENGIIALSAKNIKNGNIVNKDQVNFVNEELYNRWMPEKLQDGDILMTSEAPLGEFYYILEKTKFCLSQRLYAIRANTEKVSSSYLYYELSKGRGFSKIIGKQSGSTVFGIRQNELRKIKVLVPDDDIKDKWETFTNKLLTLKRSAEIENEKLSETKAFVLPLIMNGQVI